MTKQEAAQLLMRSLSMTPMGPDVYRLAILREQEADLTIDFLSIIEMMRPCVDCPMTESDKEKLESIYDNANIKLNSLLK